jgi:hypothetical protein
VGDNRKNELAYYEGNIKVHPEHAVYGKSVVKRPAPVNKAMRFLGPRKGGAFLKTGLSTLYVVWTALVELGLHAANTTFNTENE